MKVNYLSLVFESTKLTVVFATFFTQALLLSYFDPLLGVMFLQDHNSNNYMTSSFIVMSYIAGIAVSNLVTDN